MSEQKEQNQKSSRWARIGILITTLALVIFICAFAYGYFQLSQVNMSLARMVNDLRSQLSGNQNQLALMQTSLANLRETSHSTMAGAEQVSLQGDVGLGYVMEAYYLTKLANDQLQLTHHTGMALMLLQRADQVLARAQNPAAQEIRPMLAAAISTLQAVPRIDMTQLYLQLNAINSQLDYLPLPLNPLQPENGEDKLNVDGLPWWKAQWKRTMHTLGKIVIVRYNGGSTPPLILPEEKTFLYQNLHAQMENAMWAVLNQNAAVYQASLVREMAWIQRYFVLESPAARAIMQQLQILRGLNIQAPAMDLAPTMQLFDRYFASHEQTGTAR